MTYQPQTAGSAENDLIESMLQRQDQVLSDLDSLFDRIDAVIEDLTRQRKREAAEELQSEDILSFGPRVDKSAADSPSKSGGTHEKAA